VKWPLPEATQQISSAIYPNPKRKSRSSRTTRYGLFIRTIGIARAQAKLTLANLAYNFDRLIFHERCAAPG
jgi:hypothetical protein